LQILYNRIITGKHPYKRSNLMNSVGILAQASGPTTSGATPEMWGWSFGVILIAIVAGLVLGIGRGRGWW
jgi:hypothetical protein